MTSKEQLKRWIQHTVDTEIYGNKTRSDVKKLVEAVYADILKKFEKSNFVYSKTQYKKLLTAISEILDEYRINYLNILENQIGEISASESEWMRDFMAEVGKTFVIPATIISSINFSPIATQSNYKELVNSSVLRIQNTFDNALRNSYITKLPLDNLINNSEKKLAAEILKTDADVEVFNSTAFNLTDYLMFKANKEDVYWSSILDSRTCNECAYRHGKRYKISDIDLPPLHYNCRCKLISATVAGDKLDYDSYSQWFNDLSESEKKDTLGPGRYQLYEKGIPIDKFINNGSFISIKDLTKLL